MKFNELTRDSEALFAVFDHKLKIVFANRKFERIFTSTEMLNIHRTQASYILETRRVLLSADYARNTRGESHVALMSKRLVVSDSELVIFEGVLASDADSANIAAWGVPTQQSQRLKISEIDARLMILMRHGYTVTQSAQILSLSQKALASRFERLSQKLGAKNKMDFIAKINSAPILQSIYNTVIKENSSFIISEKIPNKDGANDVTY